MNPIPRVMAIHDLSGAGKCSLTVALPILAAMGVETVALPTAVLSTHTGSIDGYTYRDMTDDMQPMVRHWQRLGLSFDALYSGWLGSGRQNDIVMDVFAQCAGPNTLRLVDPVMGDHGRLYSTFAMERVEGMRALVAMADVITPNLTEASFLLGRPYDEDSMTDGDARALCEALSALGPARVVITGIHTAVGRVGAASWDAERAVFQVHERARMPGVWYGTGDIFGSVLLGALLAGWTLTDAAALAVDFAQDCIARTYAIGTDPRFGVDFERGLPALMRRMQDVEAAR